MCSDALASMAKSDNNRTLVCGAEMLQQGRLGAGVPRVYSAGFKAQVGSERVEEKRQRQKERERQRQCLSIQLRQHAGVPLVIKLSPKFAHPSIEAERGKVGRREGEREEPNYFSLFHCQAASCDALDAQ
ncbi:hypothetical protein INR49_012764 [Caranx melampygus]|nr:hypothetical protein INR49_012764 [Caranx melampygus]